MKLKIRKKKGKPSTVTIIRDDGTSTWSKIHPGLEFHDIGHYAVESELGFRHAFFGLINQGHDIGDFELPRDQRPAELQPSNFHEQAGQSEHIVNLLQVELQNTGEYDPEFLLQLRNILDENGIPFPGGLNEDKLKSIRIKFRELVLEINALESGQEMELDLEM